MEILKELYYDYYNQSKLYAELGDMPDVKEASAELYALLDTVPRSKYNQWESASMGFACAMEMQGWVYGFAYAMQLLAGVGANNASIQSDLRRVV